MIRNHWISSDSKPPLDEEILAKVKGFGICKMMRITSAESDKKCGYNPTIWKSLHDYTYREVNDRFVCHKDMIVSWQYINLPGPKVIK